MEEPIGVPGCPGCQKLKEELEKKQKHVEELETKTAVLEYDLKEMRDKWFSRRKKKAEESSEEGREPKKRGAPKGHRGWFRRKPKKVDVVEKVPLDRCPKCGGIHLSLCDEIEEHIQEDIILPRVITKKFVKFHYWCEDCKEVVSGKGTDEIPKSYIGPRAKAVAAFLKYVVKVSQRNIQEIFDVLCGLKIVPSSIPGFHNQTRKKALPLYERLKKEIKKSRYVHVDETGAPVDGDNHWDWIFATVNICLHVIHESRGSKVVEEILGKRYGGILLSDFLKAYNKLKAKAKQRCLIHLLRDLKKALECLPEEDSAYAYCQRLKDLLQGAIELSKQYARKEIAQRKYETKRKKIKDALEDFQIPGSQKGIVRRISKRLAQHKNELFTFLYHPGLPYHNNFVEQLLRTSVLLRKITFGQRSLNGVLNHNVLMSLQQTAKLNGKDRINLFKSILTCRKEPLLSWCLGP